MADETDRDFDEWLVGVNNDINAALEEHLSKSPASALQQDQSPTPTDFKALTEGHGRGLTIVTREQEEGSRSPAEDSRAKRNDRAILGGDDDLSDMAFLTVAEAAGVIRVSKMTIYRLVHAGELPAVRVGRSFRVPAKAIREYLSAAYVDVGDVDRDLR